MSTRRRPAALAAYHAWRRLGFTPPEAGNLTALQLLRIQPDSTTAAWTPGEVAALLFLRRMLLEGRLTGDTSPSDG